MLRAAAWLCTLFVVCASGAPEQEQSDANSGRVTVTFPKNFLWGFASSGHQTEGGSVDNWTHSENDGLNADGSPDLADDEWNRWREDFAYLKKWHMTTYRMSIEWSRIEPHEGEINQEAIENYRKQVRYLLDNGIEPQLTLQHFTFPVWVAAKGGWEWEQLPDRMAKFAQLVYAQIGPDVKRWYTFNEPNVAIFLAYSSGNHPPFETRPMQQLEKPFVGMIRTHAAIYHALHALAESRGKKIAVGIAQHLRAFDPQNPFSPIDWLAKTQADNMWNWNLLDAFANGVLRVQVLTQANIDRSIPEAKGTLDFIGVNYYSGSKVNLNLIARTAELHPFNDQYKTDIGWDISPLNFYKLLVATHRRYPKLPFMISENGVADADDSIRQTFLEQHLYYLRLAMAQGVRVDGFCQWSLIDTREWGLGWHAKFGVIALNPVTQERTVRPSAAFYAGVAERGSFEMESRLTTQPITAPVEIPRSALAAAGAWPADAKVFANGEGCRFAVEPVTNFLGQPAVKLYVANREFSSSNEEGVFQLRLPDLVPERSPSNCHVFEPFVALKSHVEGEQRVHSLTCGTDFDHVRIEFGFTSPHTDALDLTQLTSISALDYKESLRDNDAAKNQVLQPRLPTPPRKTRVEIHCRDLVRQ